MLPSRGSHSLRLATHSVGRVRAMATATALPRVTSPPANRERKEHWVNDTGTKFCNPWASANEDAQNPRNMMGFFFSMMTTKHVDAKDPSNWITISKPSFATSPTHVTATWLGHACVLLNFPSGSHASETGTSRGLNVLFDPVFSRRAGPTSYLGPARFAPAACDVSDLPEIDAIIISHNHYDHLDLDTLAKLYAKQGTHAPALLMPLNNKRCLTSASVARHVTELDWWERVELTVPGLGEVAITCTPSQHNSARGAFDKGHSLWSSWAVKDTKTGANLWFGGDTVTSETHAIDPALPVNPVFAQIGKQLGPFDMAFIPIGAYAPRHVLSPVHNAPIDAVRMFKDVAAKRAIAIHYGAFDLSLEEVSEPPKLLAKAREELGISEEDFGTIGIGESTTVR